MTASHANIIFAALALSVLLPFEGGCTTDDASPYLSPDDLESFKPVRSDPEPGAIDVCRGSTLKIFFNHAPAARSVVAAHVRVFAGLDEIIGGLKVDLLDRLIRFIPTEPLGADLRHQIYLHPDLQGIEGTTLGERVVFSFTTGTSTRTPSSVPTPSVSTKEVLAIWEETGCAGCHGAAAPRGGVDLTSVESVETSLVGAPSALDGRQRVVPGDHAKSYLMLKLLGEGGFVGYPMPPGGPRLGRFQLRQVANWIDSRAQQ